MSIILAMTSVAALNWSIHSRRWSTPVNNCQNGLGRLLLASYKRLCHAESFQRVKELFGRKKPSVKPKPISPICRFTQVLLVLDSTPSPYLRIAAEESPLPVIEFDKQSTLGHVMTGSTLVLSHVGIEESGLLEKAAGFNISMFVQINGKMRAKFAFQLTIL